MGWSADDKRVFLILKKDRGMGETPIISHNPSFYNSPPSRGMT